MGGLLMSGLNGAYATVLAVYALNVPRNWP